ncbi:flagellar hook-length control protein FliK [Glaciecola sp. MH2013]|uniref:flagellar hook-length control protein FliK n=1 Tax=Glaciecola sp. MH2013 TaxID=2785524 RepID=UPI00189FCEA5|nr:flagellar hook-length control protein FliK [Glaciecola sp. MH2013]MBF7072375.1 flagellar hook-length control protein FliK [Glaciecola sp. MH2013]
MQQFASTQTSIAASNIAFDEIKLSSPVGRDAQSTSLQSSEQRSAFEDALARQEQKNASSSERSDQKGKSIAQRNDSRDASSERAQESRERARDNQLKAEGKREELASQRERQAENQEAKQAQLREDKTQASSNDLAREDKAQKHCDNCHHDETGSDAATKANEFAAEAGNKNSDVDGVVIEENLLQSTLRKESAKDSAEQGVDDVANAALADDFDWVNYVNQIKDIANQDKGIIDSQDTIKNDLFIDKTVSSEEFFAKAVESLRVQDEVNTIEGNSANIISPESNTELVDIQLSEKELNALLEAAGVNVEESQENLSLNSEKLAELDQAIASFLNQLLNDKNAESELSDSSESIDQQDMKELNASLIKNLLGAVDVGDESNSRLRDEQSKLGTEELTIPNDLAIKIKQSSASEAVDSLQDVKPLQKEFIDIKQTGAKEQGDRVLVPELAIKAESISLSEVDASVAIADAKAATALNEPNQKVVLNEKQASLVLSLPVGSDAGKKGAELLTKLTPDAELATIENVSKRLEAVIPDLKSDGKATEFIAALQSSVKEMKEQLKLGREPGIDLKSLVSDALATADLKVPRTADINIDKQMSQITTILAAANSVNQNAQQQSYLSTGLADLQGIKEVSQFQAESSKLVQQTVVNEKAVNIFKPEGQQQLSEKVRWMVNSKHLSAEIRLDPPDLGGMNIKVNLSGDSASVNFVVQSQQAREALDQAVPRLREMLEEQGIELGQSSVEQDSSGRGQQGQDPEQQIANNSSGNGNLAQQSQDHLTSDEGETNADDHTNQDAVAEQRISGAQIGGIDYYA